MEELHDDDKPVGRILGRREILRLFGGLGAGAAAVIGVGLNLDALKQAAQTATGTPVPTTTATGTAVPACVVRPALTEGPYFVDHLLNRSDIRIEPADESVVEGVLLKINFVVTDVTDGTCKPLEGARVDVWHADAAGVYSGVDGAEDLMFLRGYQLTDEDGRATFLTVYPGWYPGRAVHIHFKIRTDPEADSGYEFTSQFFFDEALTDEVHALPPYAAKGYPNTLNEDDGIFQNSDDLLTLGLVAYEDEETGETGYETTFDVGLDLSAEPTEDPFAGGGGGGRGNRPSGTPPPRP